MAEAIRLASPTVCRAMAKFCLRLAEATNIPDEQRAVIVAEANRWHDAAVSKLDAERQRREG